MCYSYELVVLMDLELRHESVLSRETRLEVNKPVAAVSALAAPNIGAQTVGGTTNAKRDSETATMVAPDWPTSTFTISSQSGNFEHV